MAIRSQFIGLYSFNLRSFALLLSFSLSLSNSALATCGDTGANIMKKQEDKQSAKTENETQTIVILDEKSKNKEERSLQRFSLKTDSDNTKSILFFNSPVTIKGAGLLSWKESGEENQWLYVPEIKKLQRIASGSRKNYFMGTDFTYADLEGENRKKNNYNCTSVVKCQKGKGECYVIEASPINEAESRNIGYSKRLLLVDKNDLTTLKIVFYDLAGNKLKTAEYANWEKVGNLWRPNLAIMDRHGVQKTFIKVTKRELNKPVDEVVFTKRYFQKEMHIK